MGKFSFDNLKKMGEDLVGQVTSSVTSGKGSREVLPEDLKIRLSQIDKQMEDLKILQNTVTETMSELRKEAAKLCEEAITLCTPKVEKPAPTPTAAAPEEKPAEPAAESQEGKTE